MSIGRVVSITIPATVDVSDKRYCPPIEYARLPEDEVDECWTLNGKDIIVFDECAADITPEYGIAQLKKDYEQCCTIAGVNDDRNVPTIPLWKIAGI
jgi:hypothetical protein